MVGVNFYKLNEIQISWLYSVNPWGFPNPTLRIMALNYKFLQAVLCFLC